MIKTLCSLVVVVMALASCTTPNPDPPPIAVPSPGPSTTDAEPDTTLHGVGMDAEVADMTLGYLTLPTDEAGEQPPDAFAQNPLRAAEYGWDAYGIPADSPCTSSNATLLRDATTATDPSPDCAPSQGTWRDILTGATLSLDTVDVQPFIPGGHAWQVGASRWDLNQKAIYLNSPDSLVPVEPGTYAGRGNSGPDEWRPADQDRWCNYAIRWVQVKSTYGLDVTDEGEREALAEMLDTCSEAS